MSEAPTYSTVHTDERSEVLEEAIEEVIEEQEIAQKGEQKDTKSTSSADAMEPIKLILQELRDHFQRQERQHVIFPAYDPKEPFGTWFENFKRNTCHLGYSDADRIALCINHLTGFVKHVAVFEARDYPNSFEKFSFALLKAVDPKDRSEQAAYRLSQAQFKTFDEYVFAKNYVLHNCSHTLDEQTILMFIYSGLNEEYQRAIQPKLTNGLIQNFGDLVRAGRAYKEERERQLSDVREILKLAKINPEQLDEQRSQTQTKQHQTKSKQYDSNDKYVQMNKQHKPKRFGKYKNPNHFYGIGQSQDEQTASDQPAPHANKALLPTPTDQQRPVDRPVDIQAPTAQQTDSSGNERCMVLNGSGSYESMLASSDDEYVNLWHSDQYSTDTELEILTESFSDESEWSEEEEEADESEESSDLNESESDYETSSDESCRAVYQTNLLKDSKCLTIIAPRHNSKLATANGRINDQSVRLLVDSCSTCTLIHSSAAKRLGLKMENSKSNITGWNDVKVLQSNKITHLTVEIIAECGDPIAVRTTACVSENLSTGEGEDFDLLIGSNVLSSFEYTISHRGTLKRLEPRPDLRKVDPECKETVLVSILEEGEARGINAECNLQKNQANFKKVQVDDITVRIGTELTEPEEKLLIDLIRSNRKAFAATTAEMGITTTVVHTIDVQGHPPIRTPPYRTSEAKRLKIREMCEQMEAEGLIRKSKSSWSSPVVLVEKRSGEMRFCVDFRRLNSITKRDAFPAANAEDIFQNIHNVNYVSALDFRSGFHQISMAEKDKELTAFVTQDALFEWNVMPFGCVNSPATYQRLMFEVLKPVLNRGALCFLDDVLLFSETFEAHIKLLLETLTLLTKHGLRLNPIKCIFGMSNLTYLGYNIGRDGFRPSIEHIQAILKYPRPKSIEEVRSFVGLASFWRKFVNNFAHIASPLTRLFKKNATFQWNREQDDAFNKLREILTSSPVLAPFDPKRETELRTDASAVGYGAVLAQRHGSHFKPVYYASRVTNEAERNYGPAESEAAAIIWAVRKLEPYLAGIHFTIVSDHASLKFLDTAKLRGKLWRWAAILQQFNYTIVYKPGKRHKDADALSRHTTIEEEQDDNDLQQEEREFAFYTRLQLDATDRPATSSQHSDSNNLSQQTVRPIHLSSESEHSAATPYRLSSGSAHQEHRERVFYTSSEERSPAQPPRIRRVADDLNEIRSALERTQLVSPRDLQIQKRFVLKHGRIYIKGPDGDRLYPTVTDRPRIIREYHDSAFSGHRGMQQTYNRIAERYYWPRMVKQIQNYIQSCEVCQTQKYSRPQRYPLKPVEVDRPFQKVGIDLTGTLRPSEQSIVICVDYFSKYAEARLIENTDSATIAKFITQDLFCRHGCPENIVTDNAHNIDSRLIRNLSATLGANKISISTFRPEGNGEIERTIQTVKRILRTQSPPITQESVNLALFAYNTTPHRATGYSPFYILFHRRPNLPIDTVLDVQQGAYSDGHDYEQICVDLEQRWKEVKECALLNNHLSRQEYKRYYDRTARETSYNVGDLVWRTSTKIDPVLGRLYAPTFDGPYLVVRKVTPHTYRIAPFNRQHLISSVHVTKLKKYHERAPMNVITGTEQSSARERVFLTIRRKAPPKRKKRVTKTTEVEEEVDEDNKDPPPDSAEMASLVNAVRDLVASKPKPKRRVVTRKKKVRNTRTASKQIVELDRRVKFLEEAYERLRTKFRTLRRTANAALPVSNVVAGEAPLPVNQVTANATYAPANQVNAPITPVNIETSIDSLPPVPTIAANAPTTSTITTASAQQTGQSTAPMAASTHQQQSNSSVAQASNSSLNIQPSNLQSSSSTGQTATQQNPVSDAPQNRVPPNPPTAGGANAAIIQQPTATPPVTSSTAPPAQSIPPANTRPQSTANAPPVQVPTGTAGNRSTANTHVRHPPRPSMPATTRRRLAVAERRVDRSVQNPEQGSAGDLEIFEIIEDQGDRYFLLSLMTNRMKYLSSNHLYIVEGTLYVGVKSHRGRATRNQLPDVHPGRLYDVTEVDEEGKLEAICINDRKSSYCTPFSVAPIRETIYESEAITPVHSTPVD